MLGCGSDCFGHTCPDGDLEGVRAGVVPESTTNEGLASAQGEAQEGSGAQGVGTVEGPASAVVEAQEGSPSQGVGTIPVVESVCAPGCEGKACGDDGCGGSCGACSVNEDCGAAGQCERAAPPEVSDGMVRIPGGTFLMGSVEVSAAQPVHERTIAPFWMDQMEVTAGAYAECVAAEVCAAALSSLPESTAGVAEKTNHPINGVDWNQATAYCAWVGKRLPTEGEWEYAAGGRQGYFYPWGDAAPGEQLCWHNTDTRATCPVGSYPKGANGLFDMAGNVWEWTSSHECPYDSETPDGYQSDCATNARVFRGGSWRLIDDLVVSAANRNGDYPEDRYGYLGFRCAR